jgi:hypothetical protein
VLRHGLDRARLGQTDKLDGSASRYSISFVTVSKSALRHALTSTRSLTSGALYHTIGGAR